MLNELICLDSRPNTKKCPEKKGEGRTIECEMFNLLCYIYTAVLNVLYK